MVNCCCVVGCNSKSKDSKDPTAPTSGLFGFPKIYLHNGDLSNAF